MELEGIGGVTIVEPEAELGVTGVVAGAENSRLLSVLEGEVTHEGLEPYRTCECECDAEGIGGVTPVLVGEAGVVAAEEACAELLPALPLCLLLLGAWDAVVIAVEADIEDEKEGVEPL